MTHEHRIHGPPGVGKTTTLAHWISDAAQKRGPERVLVASFTRAAAREIASRGVPIPEENVGTLHALCYRALGRPEIAEGHLKSWAEFRPEWATAEGRADVDDPWGDAVSFGRSEGDRLLQEMGKLRARLVPRGAWPDDVSAFAQGWEEWKAAHGFADFSDLIERSIDRAEWEGPPGCPEVAFFDEAQDFSPAEVELVRRWAPSTEFTVFALDLDQSIYRFRGADPATFLDHPLPEGHDRVLGQSHRVPRAVHACATEWILRCARRYPTAYLPRDADGALEESFEATSDRPDAVVEACDEAARSGRSCMVLATCGYQLEQTVRGLRRRGVPFHNPYRKTNGAWNPLRGGSERILDFLKPQRRVHGAEARWWTWKEMRRWLEVTRAKETTTHGMKALVEDRGREEHADHDRVIPRDDLDVILGPDRMSELASAFEAGRELEWLSARVLDSQRRLVDYPLMVAETRGIGALSQRPTVIVGTVHSVKGGEADDVFLFPDLSPSGQREWWSGDEERDSVRRVFYVGMTRARESLKLCRRAGSASIDWHS